MKKKFTLIYLIAFSGLIFINCGKSPVGGDSDDTENEFIPYMVASFEGQTITDELLVQYSKRYRALECAILSEAQRARLRELNPDIVLIKYQATVSASLSNILVLVNPKTSEQKVTLDNSYTALDGTAYSSGDVLTLAPNRAELLRRN